MNFVKKNFLNNTWHLLYSNGKSLRPEFESARQKDKNMNYEEKEDLRRHGAPKE